jgi:hypothetical protein
MILGDQSMKKKRNKKANSPGWIGTSTRVTAHKFDIVVLFLLN